MYNGMYVAAGGMLAMYRRLDVLSNDLANVNTNGFKKEYTVFSLYEPNDPRIPQNEIRSSLYNKTINSTVQLAATPVNYSLGGMQYTGSHINLGLGNPNAFFTVSTPMGLRYTRDGNFTINTAGQLSMMDGNPIVMINQAGQPTTLNLTGGDVASLNIATDGTVLINGNPQGQLDLATFSDLNKLQPQGSDYFAAMNMSPDVVTNPQVAQGYLEQSNVNPVNAMVDMIDTERNYDFFSKLMTTYDHMNNSAANSVGPVNS